MTAFIGRRAFIALLAASAWPLAARAQQPTPIVGLINSRSAQDAVRNVAAFRKGLDETGYVEGQNVTVEYHWMEGQFDRLPALMADLVRRRVAVIATPAFRLGAQAAKAATTLATRYGIPAIYSNREFPEVGGLMSYGTDGLDTWHQVGIYTGRILKGAKPADLPVLQSTKFEFVINVQTARALGIEVPNSIQLLADEVIE